MLEFVKACFLFFSTLSLSLLNAQETDALVNSINSTGTSIFYTLEKNENSVISPLSLSASLLMAYSGARGKTAEEMANALYLTIPQKDVPQAYKTLESSLSSPSGTIKVGNSLWIDKRSTILPSYNAIVNQMFDASPQKVNFKAPKIAAHEINEWVYHQTNQKINQFIHPANITPSTKMLLINAMYVEGSWINPFPTQNSGVKPFETPNSGWVNAYMMSQVGSFPYFENHETQVLALPLENLDSKLALVLFLPKEKHLQLFNFYYSQEEEIPGRFLSYLDYLKPQNLNVTIPKFTIGQKLDLKGQLKLIGIELATSKEADFSGINGQKNLEISDASQQCVISIDEGGLYAAAASSVTLSLKSHIDQNPQLSFTANRPFLYALVDLDTKLLLFLGEYVSPTEGGIDETQESSNL